jgi:hypothetical protein
LEPYETAPCPHKIVYEEGEDITDGLVCLKDCECKVPKEWLERINKERSLGIKTTYVPPSCPYMNAWRMGCQLSIRNYKCPYTCECCFPEGLAEAKILNRKYSFWFDPSNYGGDDWALDGGNEMHSEDSEDVEVTVTDSEEDMDDTNEND